LAILQELSDTFVVDLRNFSPLGPIFHFGLFQIPPQPKKIKQWVITQRNLLNIFAKLNSSFIIWLISVDHHDYLLPFVYPVAEPSLPQASWQEYWSKKQEQEHGSMSHDQDELGDTIKSKKIDMNTTLKSNDFLECN
jgi:hypothetical protein